MTFEVPTNNIPQKNTRRNISGISAKLAREIDLSSSIPDSWDIFRWRNKVDCPHLFHIIIAMSVVDVVGSICHELQMD